MENITITPSQAMADQQLKIVAKGLKIASKYTLVAQMERQAVIYQSYAHYVSDSEGTIDVSTMTSLGGSYEGVEPMGLIWFLEPLASKQAAKASLIYQLNLDRKWITNVYLIFGHVTAVSEDAILPVSGALARAVVETHIDHPFVRRYDVRDGRLKATLFVPEGRGPFLGVLDLYAWVPGVLYERRAALLAARGYVTMALAFVEYEGTNLHVNDVQLEYFLEALEWLDQHPKVAKCGLAITSHCYSGLLAFHLATLSPKVKAITTINSPSYNPFGKVTFQGRTVACWQGGGDIDPEQLGQVLSGLCRKTFPANSQLEFPIENLPEDVHLLLTAAADDAYISPDHTRALARRLQKAGRKNVKVVMNRGQGHSYSEPHVPLIRGTFDLKGTAVNFAGHKYAHERGAEIMWNETVDFLQQCKQRFQLTNYAPLTASAKL